MAGTLQDLHNSCSFINIMLHRVQHYVNEAARVMQVLYESVCRVYRPTRHIIGNFGDDFNRPDDQTNSVKALKETTWSSCMTFCYYILLQWANRLTSYCGQRSGPQYVSRVFITAWLEPIRRTASATALMLSWSLREWVLGQEINSLWTRREKRGHVKVPMLISAVFPWRQKQPKWWPVPAFLNPLKGRAVNWLHFAIQV